jgi:hypothetical protein
MYKSNFVAIGGIQRTKNLKEIRKSTRLKKEEEKIDTQEQNYV